MYDRFLGYRSGREPLPGLAYFCLTMLEKSAGIRRERNRDTRRQKVADKYGIDQAVLNKIGQLSSEKGGSEARKASGIGRELTPSEACFLKKAVPVLIRRAAEVAHDPNESRDTIMLSELCLEAAQHHK